MTQNLSKVCRICNDEAEINIKILDSNNNVILQKVHKLLPVKIKSDDDLPSTVCNRCVSLVIEFDDFYEKCAETQRNLKINLSNDDGLHSTLACDTSQNIYEKANIISQKVIAETEKGHVDENTIYNGAQDEADNNDVGNEDDDSVILPRRNILKSSPERSVKHSKKHKKKKKKKLSKFCETDTEERENSTETADENNDYKKDNDNKLTEVDYSHSKHDKRKKSKLESSINTQVFDKYELIYYNSTIYKCVTCSLIFATEKSVLQHFANVH